MAVSTWTWNGSTWTLTAGPGNASGHPQTGDTAIIAGGTIVFGLDAMLNNNTVYVGGTGGVPAALVLSGDTLISTIAPTIDPATTVSNAVPGSTAPEAALISASGLFINNGNILANGPAGSTFTIATGPLVSNGVTTAGQFINTSRIDVRAGNSLIVSGGTFASFGDFVVDGGSAVVNAVPGPATAAYQFVSNDFTIVHNGRLELSQASTAAYNSITFAAGGFLKIDSPASGFGNIAGFAYGDTIDLGVLNIATIAYDGYSDFSAIGSNGSVLFATGGYGGGVLAGGNGPQQFVLSSTGGNAGNVIVTQGNGGDTLLTVAPPSTWRWANGVSGAGDTAADWTLASGPGNGFGTPTSGDTAIETAGTINFGADTNLNAVTIVAGATGGAVATLNATTDYIYAATRDNPTLDQASVISTAVPGQTTAEATVLNAAGPFVNNGTILADGPAGSTLTINAGPMLSGSTIVPGYFFNFGTIEADAGNTVVINVAGTAELQNAGTILAKGGAVIVHAATNAIVGGYAPIYGMVEISNGGTFETNATMAATANGTYPSVLFLDNAKGNTLKLDSAAQFTPSVIGFQAGDTIDLGQIAAVSSIVVDSTAAIAYLDNAAGSILVSLALGSPLTQSGTFAVNPTTGAAGVLNLSTGANGDTLLTTSVGLSDWNNTSGAWQTAGSWSGAGLPNGTLTAEIGQGSTAAFTLTTGSAAVSAASVLLLDPNALVQITSPLSVNPLTFIQAAGSVEIANGGTLTTTAYRNFSPTSTLTLDPGAVLDLTGRVSSTFENNGTISYIQGNTQAAIFNGPVLVNGGTINAGPNGQAGGRIAIGYLGAAAPAEVIVTNGGVVTATYTRIGSDPTGRGNLGLNGAGTTWTDQIDPNDPLNSRGYMDVGVNAQFIAGVPAPPTPGTAYLTVLNSATLTDASAYIADGATTQGEATVETGGVWNIGLTTGGRLNIGIGGYGTLSVLNGGTVNLGGFGQIHNGATTLVTVGGIGVGFSSSGSVGSGAITVTGSGAVLTSASGISLGEGGQGILSVSNGGSVGVSGGSVSVGFSTGGPASGGTLTVGGPGAPAFLTLGTAAGGLLVGGSAIGALGTFVVADSGTVSLSGTGGLTIGSGSGSSGTASVGGTTAAAVVNIGAGGLTVGGSGTGFMSVNALGTVALTGIAGLIVGQFGAGSLTVNGGLLTTTGGLNVGLSSSAATMAVTNGGTVAVNGGAGTIGANAGSNGTVTVSGGASALRATGSVAVTVGASGTGTLLVSGGATVSEASFLSLGANSGGRGVVTVSGAALSAQNITVGGAGTGTLAVTGGTVASSGVITIGANSFGSGTVSVSGAGGTLSASGGIQVGTAGTGTLVVQGDRVSTGSLSIAGTQGAPQSNGTNKAVLTGGADIAIATALAIWSTGTLSLDATSGVDIGTSGSYAAGAVNIESGHSLTGDGTIAANIINNGLIVALGTTAPNAFPAGTLDVQGNLTGNGSISLNPEAIVRVDGSLAVTQQVNFVGGAAAGLILANPGAGFANQVTGLSVGDQIYFGNGMTITSVAVVNGNTIQIGEHGSNGIATTYALTNVGFAAGTPQQFSWGTNFSTGFAFIQVQPSAFNWAGTGGTDYGTGSDWQGGVAPNAAGTVSFVNNPGTVTGSGSALSLNIGNYNASNFGNWTFNNTTLTVAGSPNVPFLPFAVGFNQNTVLNGGTLNASGGTTSIGGSSGATVTAQAGAKVTTLGDSVGTNSGQAGSLYLTGAGTTWTELAAASTNSSTPGFLNVGFNGPGNGFAGSAGFLTVTNGASLATGGYAQLAGLSGSYGIGTISAGGVWMVGSGLTVGGGGSGTLAVSGGTVSAAGFVGIGQGTGSYGTVSVTSGGSLTGSTGVTVGQSGEGTLTVSGANATVGGQLTLGSNLGGFGQFSLSSGTVTAGGGLQISASGGGFATIGAGGTLTLGSNFSAVGNSAGSGGLLVVSNGGTVASTAAAFSGTGLSIGNSAATTSLGSASGTVVVAGTGSTLNLNNNSLSLGSGNAELTIASGGTVKAGGNGNALTAAVNSGAQAAISVLGSTSVLSLVNGLNLGQGGNASLLVSGGTVAIAQSGTFFSGVLIGSGNPSFIGETGGASEATITNGGTLSTPAAMTLGGNGSSGVLNVSAGGQVLLGGSLAGATALTVGTAILANGTVYGGTGSLNIGAGGTVLVQEVAQTNSAGVVIGAANGNVGQQTGNAQGDVVVSGAGALLSTNGSPLEVGKNAVGNLTISQGGTVLTGTTNSNNFLGLYVGRYSTGSILLTDSGSALIDTGSVGIGRAGSGNLLIQNHATMIVNNDTTGTGGIVIGSAQGTSNSVQTSVQTGGAGVAQVTTGGYLYSQQTVTVGKAGASGALSVNNGGTVEAGTSVNIGQAITLAAGGSIIASTGTTIVPNGTLLTGAGVINVGAGGLLRADGAGIAAAGSSDINVGSGVAANANLNVSGAGATVNSEGYRIEVGGIGSGALLISQGGTVLAGTPFANDQAIFAGGSAGATGAVTITDAGSELLATGQFAVGYGGQGALLIQNQGTAVTGNNTADAAQGFDIGVNAGASGIATVTGTGSALSNTGRFVVGDAGLGSLNIDAGGTVATGPGTSGLAAAVIANTTSASGSSVNVSGAGSNWQVGGSLIVGNAGAGGLAIAAGGSVAASSLDAGALAGGSGVVSVAGTGASLGITGSLSVGDAGAGELSVLAGATVAVGGNLNIGGTAGGSGNVDIEAGTLTVGGSLTYGAGGPGVLTVGIGAHVTVAGGVIGGAHGALVQFAPIDPTLLDGGTDTLNFTAEQDYSGYIDGGANIDVGPGYSPTLDVPVITGGVQINIGSGTSDTQAATLTLNAGTVSANSAVTFKSSLGTLVIGTDALGTIDIQSTDSAGATLVANPELGSPLIANFGATVYGFQAGDAIIVDTPQAAAFALNGSIVSVNAGAVTLGTIAFATAAMAAAAVTGGLTDQVAAGGSVAVPALTSLAGFGSVSGGANIVQAAPASATYDTAAGATVTVYDGATQIGSGTANAAGVAVVTLQPLGAGTHTLTATASLGSASAASAAVTLTVAPAAQTIFSLGGGASKLVAGDGNDQINFGNTGSAVIAAGNGYDQISGGDAAASISLGSGGSRVLLGAGRDSVSMTGGSVFLIAGNGADSVSALGGSGSNSDNIYLGSGNDTVVMGDATGNVITGDGTDSITVGNGNDIVTAGNGPDTIVAGNGNDYIKAGSGSDTVTAGSGSSGIQLGDGNDTVSAGAGNDTILLGNGNDSVNLGTGTDYLRLGTGTNTVTGTAGAKSVELYGSGTDTVTLSGGNELIYGTGTDTINAGGGNNVIAMQGGADQVTAGDGNNTVQMINASAANTVSLGNGTNKVILGTAGATVTAGNGANYIEAFAGNNTITVGNNAGNVVKADSGSATITLGAGSGSGNGPSDTFVLGSGGGNVTGGWGSNVYQLDGGAWFIAASTGSESVELDSPGAFAYVQTVNTATDLLEVSSAAFGLGLGLSGSQTASIGALLSTATDGSFSSAGALFAYNAANGVVSYRPNAVSGSSAIAELANDPAGIAGIMLARA